MENCELSAVKPDYEPLRTEKLMRSLLINQVQMMNEVDMKSPLTLFAS